MKIDNHMHTSLCGHAIGTPREYVEAAQAQGIELITFTCHMPMDPDHLFGGRGIRMSMDQLPQYRELVEDARQYGESIGVKVLCGIEGEIFPLPMAMESMKKAIEDQQFDFVLGSLHHQLGGYRDWLDEMQLLEDGDVIRTYFKGLISGVRSGVYDSIAHPDVIRIYGTVEPFPAEAYQAEIEEFLDVLKEEDHCMEVNTSGLIKGVYEVHPAPVVLDWAAERGIKLTMGSDAHAPGQVGQHFDAVREMLRQKGFKSLYYFENRQRKETPL
ncbi:MAG: histidinol-phosphatase [Puniceicoccales bacterium]